jgi:hypothetical protein
MLYTLNAKQKNYVNFFEILSFGVILHCLAALYTTNSTEYCKGINRKITWIITDTSVLPWFCKFIISIWKLVKYICLKFQKYYRRPLQYSVEFVLIPLTSGVT